MATPDNQTPRGLEYTKFCDGCLKDNKREKGDHWCRDCREFICITCVTNHRQCSPSHKVVPTERETSLDPSTSGSCLIKQEGRSVFFCGEHECEICDSPGAEFQNTCKSKLATEKESNDTQDDTKVNSLAERLEDMIKIADSLMHDFAENLSTLDIQKREVEKKIIESKLDIISKLEKIEKKHLTDLAMKHTQIKEVLSEKCKKLRILHDQSSDLMNDLKAVKDSVSDSNIIETVKILDENVDEQENMLRDIKNTNKIIDMEFEPYQDILYLQGEKFGDIVVKENENTNSTNSKEKPASQSISTRSCTLVDSFETSELGEDIQVSSGCFMSENKLLLVAYKQKCLFTCNKNGTHGHRIDLLHSPSSVAIVDQNVAVVSLKTDGIEFIDLDIMTPFKQIMITGYCDQIASSRDKVWVDVDNHLCKIDRNGKILKRISTPFHNSGFCIDDKNTIYCSSAHEVCCINSHGKRHLFYQNPELRSPSDLAVDNDGNLYVLDVQSRNVQRISREGQHGEIIVTEDNGIEQPTGLAYNWQTNEIMIIHKRYTAINIYKLQDRVHIDP